MTVPVDTHLQLDVRPLILVGLLLLLVPPASAQVDVRVGFKEGGNFATLGGADGKQAMTPVQNGSSLSRRPGLIIGGLVEFDPSGPFGVQSEAIWIWKGAKLLTEDTEAVTKVNYLEVPLFGKYQSPLSWGSVKTYLLAGPTVAFATAAQRKQMGTDSQGQPRLINQTDLNESTRNVELGFAVGGEAAYQFSDRAALSLGVRYRRGLTRAFGDSANQEGVTLDAWHKSLALTLGFVYSSGWSFSFN